VPFRLEFTPRASQELRDIEFKEGKQDPVRLKKIRKCLGLLESNPRHPGLETHEFRSMLGAQGEKVWEAYVENNTPSAWRVFWHYGPEAAMITIIAITPHP
jgi:hypothetical protein